MKNIFGIIFIEKKDLEYLEKSLNQNMIKIKKLTKEVNEVKDELIKIGKEIRVDKDLRKGKGNEFYGQFNSLKKSLIERVQSDYAVVKTEIKAFQREIDNIKKVVSA